MKHPIKKIIEINFDDIKETIDESKLFIIQKRSENIKVYRVEFDVNGRLGVGYIVSPKAEKPVGGLVFCRGGVGEFSKVTEKTGFGLLGRFAERGYIVFAPQYAGNDGGQGLDQVGGQDLEDILIAPDVFNSFLGYNLENIGVYAMSRGAIMAYKTLVNADWIVAMVVVGGLTNVERNISTRQDILEAWKDRFPQNIEEYRDRSAICFVDKLPKNVPIFLMHGLCDWRVSPQDTLDLSARFFEFKIPHRLICFEGADHGLTEVRDESIDYSIKWFDRFVRDREEIPGVMLHGA